MTDNDYSAAAPLPESKAIMEAVIALVAYGDRPANTDKDLTLEVLTNLFGDDADFDTPDDWNDPRTPDPILVMETDLVRELIAKEVIQALLPAAAPSSRHPTGSYFACYRALRISHNISKEILTLCAKQRAERLIGEYLVGAFPSRWLCLAIEFVAKDDFGVQPFDGNPPYQNLNATPHKAPLEDIE